MRGLLDLLPLGAFGSGVLAAASALSVVVVLEVAAVPKVAAVLAVETIPEAGLICGATWVGPPGGASLGVAGA